jgi:lipoprotein-anchoring transpeptidase ErfK/SrfK
VRIRSIAILIGLLVAVLLAAAGAVYAYDSGRSDTIAKGVSVSGVDVSELQPGEARTKLRRALLDPLRKPVTVRYKGRRFTLTASQARVGIDLDGSVEAALARSQQGNMLSRTIRDLRGERVDAEVPVEVKYSRAAVRRLVKRVSAKLDEPARDAEVSFAGGRIDRKPSRTGRVVRTALLRRRVDAALLSLDGPRAVAARTRTVQPEVSTEDVAKKYPAILMVDRGAFTLTLYKDLKPAKTYGIAVGQVGLDTPAGLYKIQNKAIDPAWSVPDSDWAGDLAGQVIPGGTPENPLKARWLGVYDGVGIHGTADEGSIGSNASHGCIRMRVAEVKELYDEVPVGAPIYIA